MHRECPCRFDGNLCKGPKNFFFHLFLFLVVGVLHVFPYLPLHKHFGAVLERYIDRSVAQPRHLADGAITPSALLVVTDKDDLGPFFQS